MTPTHYILLKKLARSSFFFKNLCHNFFVRNPLIFLAPPKSRVVEDDNSNLDRCLGCNFNPAPPLLLLLRCPPSPLTVSWSKWSHFGKCFICKCDIRYQCNIENLVWSQLNSIDYQKLRGFRAIIGTFQTTVHLVPLISVCPTLTYYGSPFGERPLLDLVVVLFDDMKCCANRISSKDKLCTITTRDKYWME